MHRGFPLFLIRIRLKWLATPPQRHRESNSCPISDGGAYLCATQAAICEREENPCFLRILLM